MKFITNSETETKNKAARFGEKLTELAGENDKAVVVSLQGKLGAGKTTFVKGLGAFMEVGAEITSPTFVILKKYECGRPEYDFFYHIDCYRLEDPQELLKLGAEDIFENKRNLVVIEWGDKVKSVLPERTITVKFEFKESQKREISLNSNLT